MLKQMANGVTYVLWKALCLLMRLCPRSLCLKIGKGLGVLAWVVLPARRRIAETNIALSSLGATLTNAEHKRLVKRVFMNVGITAVEFLAAPRFVREWREHIRARAEDYALVQGLLKERGVIFLVAHFYNWEILPILTRPLAVPLVTVGQTIKNPYLDKDIKASRRALGVELWAKQGFMAKALKALEEKHMVAIVADQNAGRHGQRREFLGREASTFTTPVILALKSGCPIIPVYDVRDMKTGEHLVVLDAVIDPADYRRESGDVALDMMMRSCLQSLETQIRRYPEGWFWLHKRWKQ